MTNHTVLSVNPETKTLELMPYERLGDAESQQQRAIREGRLLVEIVDTREKHEAWEQKAKQLIASLPCALHSAQGFYGYSLGPVPR